ncbi:MAG: response regulator, partial [Ginsengibacter sp.]
MKNNSEIDFRPPRLPENTTILIADDEPDILEIISFNLRSEGYNVLTANNGNEAVDLAVKYNPSLIILDLMMPGKTGIEVCKILRSKPNFKETLIIYLTAINDESM